MNDGASADGRDGGRVNWRSTGDGVRVYDEDDPDAWVEVSFEAGVLPEKWLFTVCPDCGFVAPQRTGPGRGMVCGECGAEVSCE
jgi:hypothetical protein